MTTDADFEVLERERPRLRALAYRMLGSITDADDVLQDVAERWHALGPAGRAALERPAAWLTTVCTHRALDELGAARRRRETYVGPWLPEPVLTDGDPADAAELADSLTLGFLVVLDRLSPIDRAVFLLADVFREPFADIAAAVGRSEEACRQIASRARRRVRDERGVVGRHVDGVDRNRMLHAFIAACVAGEVDELKRLLVDDVVLVSDGGPHVRAARRPVLGPHRVSRLMLGLVARFPADADIELREVNGEPGVLATRGGQPWMVLTTETDGERIVTVRIVLNPDKLRHLGDG
jgi:RNA polymerase sigma-70 factor (ECF subfamily)